MIFLKKKSKKSSDAKPEKKKNLWKRNSWLRLNLPDGFSSTIEIPQLQNEKNQDSVFEVNTTESNKGENISPTTNNNSTYIEQDSHQSIHHVDLSCSRNDQLINKHQQTDNTKDILEHEDQSRVAEYNTPETVCEQLVVTTTLEEQDCKKAEKKKDFPVKSHGFNEKVMDSEVVPSNEDEDTKTISSLSSSCVIEEPSLETGLYLVQELKKGLVLDEKSSLQQGEDQLSTEKKTVVLVPNSDSKYIKEEVSHKEESKVMKRKSAQSFIPRSCKQSSGASPEEEVSSPLRGSSNSHLPILVTKISSPIENTSSSSSCSTHSEDSIEKKAAQLSKIPTVVPAKYVKNNSSKTHTSRLPKKRNT